jgi:hypothetical protein
MHQLGAIQEHLTAHNILLMILSGAMVFIAPLYL